MKNVLLLSMVLTVLFSYGQTEKPVLEKAALSIERMEILFTRLNMVVQKTGNQNTSSTITENALKSATAKQKLDSVVTKALDLASSTLINDWKDEYIYNSKSELTGYWEKEWVKELASWQIAGKTEFEYNAKGMPTSMTFSSTDNPTKQLLPESRTLIYYNNSDKTDSLITMSKDENQQWIKDSKSVYTYNAAGKVSKIVMEATEEDEGEVYITKMTYTFTYDSSNRLTRMVLAISDDEDEIIFSTTDNTWNTSGQLTIQEVSTLSFFTFTLQKSNRTEIQYNANGDISLETDITGTRLPVSGNPETKRSLPMGVQMQLMLSFQI
jgi:hypothetical protein